MNVPTTPIPCSTGGQRQQLPPPLPQQHTNNTHNKPYPEFQLPPVMSSSSSSQQQLEQQQQEVIQRLYTNTFSYIGNEFMDAIVRELGHWTQTQAVMLLQFMTREEYKQLTQESSSSSSFSHEDTYSHSTIASTASAGRTIATVPVPSTSRERSPIQSTFTLSGSPPSLSNSDSTTTNNTLYDTTTPSSASSSHINSNNIHNNDKYLIVRSSFCSSQQQHHQPENYLPNTALKISAGQETPFAKTLRDSVCNIPERSFYGFSAFSSIQSFVGLRLDEDTPTHTTLSESSSHSSSKTVGVLCVMDSKPMDPRSMRFIEGILKATQPRLARELGRVIHEERLTRAKNAAKMDAENKIKFLADMSHEIRNPMNAVIALTDLLLRERASLNTEQTEHLEVIQTSGHHLLTVINDILDISKINHDPKFKLESRRFSLRKCMKDALNMARHQASMSQPGKIVHVTEYPAEMNDHIPLRQMIDELEKSNFLPSNRTENKTRLQLLWRIDPDVPDILMGDTMRLTQVMLNLCSNAVKFTKDGGVRVRIKRCMPTPARPLEQEDPSTQTSLKRRYDAKIETMWSRAMRRTSSNDGNSNNNTTTTTTTTITAGGYSDDENDESRSLEKAILEISVTDTGIGIPADRLPRLFKSFSQIDISTARRYGGTGLGLAITSTLVNHMGGCLWVESEQEVGSCFALTLPLTIASSKGHHHHHSLSTAAGSGMGSIDDTAGLESASNSSILASPDSPGLSEAEYNLSINSALEEEEECISVSSSDVIHPTATTNPTSASSPISSPQMNTSQEPSQWNIFTPPLRSPATEPSQFTAPSYQALSKNNNAPKPIPESNTSSTSPDLPMDISSCNGGGNATQRTMTSDEQNKTHHPHPHPLNYSHSFSSPKSESSTSENNPSRITRHSSFRQSYHHHHHHHHHKKSTATDNNEENIAMMYPIKIMLAEDNVLNQKIATSILKRLGYHDVMVANNGCEVLELMRKVKFDVIFMDLYMPDMDGLEATRAIVSERESGPSSQSRNRPLLNVTDVYIIALTASASRQDRQICIDAGMNDFISKPFTIMEMKASLKNCVSKRKRRRKQEDQHHHHPHHQHQHHQQHDRYFQQQQQQQSKDDPMIGVEHTTTTTATSSSSTNINGGDVVNEFNISTSNSSSGSDENGNHSGDDHNIPSTSGRRTITSSKAAV